MIEFWESLRWIRINSKGIWLDEYFYYFEGMEAKWNKVGHDCPFRCGINCQLNTHTQRIDYSINNQYCSVFRCPIMKMGEEKRWKC
jgi:hypothetical protein